MSKQLFIIIQATYGAYYALPAGLAGVPFMQALPHLREVKKQHVDGEYRYVYAENQMEDFCITFEPIYVKEQKSEEGEPEGPDTEGGVSTDPLPPDATF